MAKLKSKRFKILQKLAGRYEDLAAQDLGVSVGNLGAQQSRLIELQKFRDEYTQQLYQSGVSGINSTVMQSFQQFICQIDAAIQQQKKTVQFAEQDHQLKKHKWEDKHKETRIYDKTIEKFTAREENDKEQRDQVEIDDRNNARLKLNESDIT
mgnify:CR=1 FL=1